MIIDLILDRKDGHGYTAREFYFNVMEYRYLTPEDCDAITRAMDGGTNEDVCGALCAYIISQGYNPALCAWICRQNWL